MELRALVAGAGEGEGGGGTGGNGQKLKALDFMKLKLKLLQWLPSHSHAPQKKSLDWWKKMTNAPAHIKWYQCIQFNFTRGWQATNDGKSKQKQEVSDVGGKSWGNGFS